MRVVLLTDNFSKQTGYLSNALPRALARLGADVHLVTMDLPPYYNLQDFNSTYSNFTGRHGLRAGTREKYDGYTLHVLGHRRTLGHMRHLGLKKVLEEIQPDVVQSLPAIGWYPLEAAWLKLRLGFALFTGNHTTASVFPLATEPKPFWHPARIKNLLTRTFPGRLVSLATVKCYGATTDCADVAVRFFGVQASKIDVCPLGVETDAFHPVRTGDDRLARAALRQRLGFRDDEIVCIYTGRFTADKNPLLLAQAIERLRHKGLPFRSLFLGDGMQAEAIRSVDGAVVHQFVPYDQLPNWYRAAEIGVWPTQESTSMLDAAACGIPVVVNDTLRATERIEGNGLTYRLNDVEDLERVLARLADRELRKSLGETGARRMRELFSWDAIAARRLRDYTMAARSNRKAPLSAAVIAD